MSVKMAAKDDIIFYGCQICVSDILDSNLKYKLCLRFDGGLELVAKPIKNTGANILSSIGS